MGVRSSWTTCCCCLKEKGLIYHRESILSGAVAVDKLGVVTSTPSTENYLNCIAQRGGQNGAFPFITQQICTVIQGGQTIRSRKMITIAVKHLVFSTVLEYLRTSLIKQNARLVRTLGQFLLSIIRINCAFFTCEA